MLSAFLHSRILIKIEIGIEIGHSGDGSRIFPIPRD